MKALAGFSEAALALWSGAPPPEQTFAIHRPALVIEARPSSRSRWLRGLGGVALALVGIGYALGMLAEGPVVSYAVMAILCTLAAIQRFGGLSSRSLLLLRDDSLVNLSGSSHSEVPFSDLRTVRLGTTAYNGNTHLELHFRDGRKKRILSGVGTAEGLAIVGHVLRSVEGRTVGANPYRTAIPRPLRLAVAEAVTTDLRLANALARTSETEREAEEMSSGDGMEESPPMKAEFR